MKKDEILKKARAERSDEMEKAVSDRSAVWMVVAMALAAGFFVCMRGEDAPIADLGATTSFSTAVCMIYRFIRLKKLYYLIAGIALAAVTVVLTVRFFQGH